MFYLVQRTDDAARFALAADIDPDYTKAFEKAMKTGVEDVVLWLRYEHLDGITIGKPLTMDLPK